MTNKMALNLILLIFFHAFSLIGDEELLKHLKLALTLRSALPFDHISITLHLILFLARLTVLGLVLPFPLLQLDLLLLFHLVYMAQCLIYALVLVLSILLIHIFLLLSPLFEDFKFLLTEILENLLLEIH